MTRDPIHPGKFLADELEALNMTPTQLAAALKVPLTAFTSYWQASGR